MIYAQPRISPWKWGEKNYQGFWNTNGSPNLGQTTRLRDTQQKKNLLNSGLCCYSLSLGKTERKWKERVVTRTEKLWNMKMTLIPIGISALRTVTRWLVQGLEDLKIRRRVETYQITALLRSARISRRILETCRDLLSLRLQWKTICKHWS